MPINEFGYDKMFIVIDTLSKQAILIPYYKEITIKGIT